MRNKHRVSPYSSAGRNAPRCVLFRSQAPEGQINIPTRRRWAAGLVSLLAVIASVALVAAAPPALAADEAPEWLRQAASSSLSSYDKTVPAVVLYHESTMNVDADGRVVIASHWAVKVLTREGRRAAIGRAVYQTDSEKVKDFQAWLIRPSGTVKRYKKEQVLDMVLSDDDVYDEARQRIVDASDDAEDGAVFGYESTVERKQVFTQSEWYFQHRNPVVLSRITLNLPTGWQAEGVTFNHAKIEPKVAGSSYSWELRDLPFTTPEPASPPQTSVAPRLAISYFPSDKSARMAQAFNDWTDVSRWLSQLSDPQATPNDAITQKARSLVAGASTEIDQIKAIAAFVQATHYVSIQTGLGRGGGYRPHSAADVFAKNYGDCKDKANLMRAMLKVIGIQSFPVSICADDPIYVRKEWPSPQQFNHCIIAIKVKDDTRASTIVEHPTLGHLLIFDPTDPYTPVGDLPEDEQGSLALIVAGDAGRLMAMPVTPPEDNMVQRRLEATLNPDGSLSAVVREEATGQAAVKFRAEYNLRARADFTKSIERWVTSGANSATIAKIEPKDDRAANRFTMSVEFSAPSYAQLMQGRLLVFKPAIVSRREALPLGAGARKQPVILNSNALDEEVKVKLPSGFDVDELPDPAKLDTPFGRYSASYQVKDGYLIFTRKLITVGTLIPAEKYSSVKSFFERVRGADSAPVVLAKK
ncbi:MAG TPA: DUF3857 and transglutaminase domain-containing protein [Blastocatellia bacterium]|nr:DUF3857 and transglutaminase domain-containing protein [Blastocatellia bacterium]